MKIPRSPPPVEQLAAANHAQLPVVLQRGAQPTVNGRYLHWDELQHRKAPTGLDHAQWWLGIKLARSLQYRELPLRDTQGRPFVYLLTDRIHEALHRIDSRAGGLVGMPAQVTNADTRDRFIVNSLIEEAITSSQLEGASTTRAVAADMIRAGRRPRDRSEQMILNNYLAMQSIRRLRDEALSLPVMLTLHETLTAATLDDPQAAGRVQRPTDERVRVWDDRDQSMLYTPPPASALPARLDAMMTFANRESSDPPFLHPVIHAIVLHFWLAYEHPFFDGNGRTARALFYWAMLRHGYWMFEFISISRQIKQAPARYARAFLHSETDGNDLTYFILQQIEVIGRAVDDLDAYIRGKVEQVEAVERILKRANDLNHRQIALLAHAIRHPRATYTVQSHRTSHAVVYATARADLLKLAELGLLEQRRAGKKKYEFLVPPDVEERIRQFAERR
ncbi:MAG: Fic family protein [Gammaproteobacteria bacterium]